MSGHDSGSAGAAGVAGGAVGDPVTRAAASATAPVPAPASTPSASLRERQRTRTRDDLVRATIDVIELAGLEGATIDRIIRRAGTSRATLYAHFPSGRSELLGEAYRVVGDDLVADAGARAASGHGWIDRVDAYHAAMLRLATRRELSVFYNVSGPQHFGIGKRRGSGSQQSLDAIARELASAQAAEAIGAELDVQGIAALLVGAIREAGIDATRSPASATHHERAFRQLLEALAATGGARSE